MELNVASIAINWKKFNQTKKMKDYPSPEVLEQTATLNGNVLKPGSYLSHWCIYIGISNWQKLLEYGT